MVMNWTFVHTKIIENLDVVFFSPHWGRIDSPPVLIVMVDLPSVLSEELIFELCYNRIIEESTLLTSDYIGRALIVIYQRIKKKLLTN